MIPRSQCTCTGHVLTYECTVTGSGSTVWKGSAFECTSGEIVLQHNLFDQMMAAGVCNDGLFSAYGIRVDNNSYTSQLNITVSHSAAGKTIECAYDNGQREASIGTDTISITTGKLFYYCHQECIGRSTDTQTSACTDICMFLVCNTYC